MLVGRCSSELSGHKLQAKLKKSQALSVAEGTSTVPISPMPLGAFKHRSPLQARDTVFPEVEKQGLLPSRYVWRRVAQVMQWIDPPAFTGCGKILVLYQARL
jgi:hypothetical protein